MVRNASLRLLDYSLLKLFTGLAMAALTDWKLTTANAIKTAPRPALSIMVDKERQVFRAITEEKYKTKEAAQLIVDGVKETGNIFSIEAKPRKEPPPLLHDIYSPRYRIQRNNKDQMKV